MVVPELEQLSLKEREDIDRQVERILKHPLFHHSKRLPIFLRYIVETSLSQGGQGATKERTVGIEVFGRKPDYDNNSDPIVRVTATELRKKLAQYYYEDGHSDEIRIELPPGSYLPRFRRSLKSDAADRSATPDSQSLDVISEPIQHSQVADEPEPVIVAPSNHRWIPWPVLVGVLSALVMIMTALLLQRFLKPPDSHLNGFWSDVGANSDRVFIVMPVIGSDNLKDADIHSRSASVSPNLSLEDTDIAARIASQLEKQSRRFQLVSSPEVTLDQLQNEPSVLIGALDNIWTMRLSRELPFAFEEAPDHKTGRIVDTSSPSPKSWMVDIDMPHKKIAHDYGIVARYKSRLAGQTVVIVAGISSQGTQAAGKLLTSSDFESIQSISKKAPNFEVVIETEAIDGHAAQPQVVASKTW